MKYKALFFDLDGTLLDTLNDIVRAINASLKTCGYDKSYTYEDGKKLVGSGAHIMAVRAFSFCEHSEAEFQKFEGIFFNNYKYMQAETTKPFDGIPELLERAHRKGYLLFVGSNKPDLLAKAIVSEKLNADIFQEIIGVCPGYEVKPNPAFINDAIFRHNLTKKDILYIGDSHVDVETARNAGVDVCLVTYGYGNYTKEVLEKATYVAHSVSELSSLL